MPPIPTNFQEVVVEGEWAETWRGDDFLSKHHEAHRFLLFTTEENLTKLAQCPQV